jgi:DNA-binding MarR family transcriptional regulator
VPTATDPALASALRGAVMMLGRRLRRERGTDALSSSQIGALASLDRHGALTLGELANHEYVRPPSMTRIVASLEEAGLVTRAADPTDGRQVILSATAEGSRLLEADRQRRDAWLARQMQTLTADERDTLRRAAVIIDRISRS